MIGKWWNRDSIDSRTFGSHHSTTPIGIIRLSVINSLVQFKRQPTQYFLYSIPFLLPLRSLKRAFLLPDFATDPRDRGSLLRNKEKKRYRCYVKLECLVDDSDDDLNDRNGTPFFKLHGGGFHFVFDCPFDTLLAVSDSNVTHLRVDESKCNGGFVLMLIRDGQTARWILRKSILVCVSYTNRDECKRQVCVNEILEQISFVKK